jgi:hypothetical protein
MSVNEVAAIAFVQPTGNAVELARLRFAVEGSVPPPEVRTQVLADQREDGGWSPFWAPDYSSLDATCFRLAQAEQLGLTPADAAIQRALAFLARRQRQDGSWEEEAKMAAHAPPWVAPGTLAACLYLSANCGYWLAIWANSADGADHAQRAADYVRAYQEHDGGLPGFPHTLWLSGGLWYRLGRHEDAESAFRAVASTLADMPASSLAWLLSTLLLAGAPADHVLVEQAAIRLEALQEPDGRWSSEDGPMRDVHTTVEALHVLTLCRR